MTRFVKKSVGGTILGLGLVGFATAGVAGYQMHQIKKVNQINKKKSDQRLAYVVVKKDAEAFLEGIEEVMGDGSDMAKNMINKMNNECKNAKKNVHVFYNKMIFLCANEADKEATEKLLRLPEQSSRSDEEEQPTSLRTLLAVLKEQAVSVGQDFDAESYDVRWQTYVLKGSIPTDILSSQKEQKMQEQEDRQAGSRAPIVDPLASLKTWDNVIFGIVMLVIIGSIGYTVFAQKPWGFLAMIVALGLYFLWVVARSKLQKILLQQAGF